MVPLSLRSSVDVDMRQRFPLTLSAPDCCKCLPIRDMLRASGFGPTRGILRTEIAVIPAQLPLLSGDPRATEATFPPSLCASPTPTPPSHGPTPEVAFAALDHERLLQMDRPTVADWGTRRPRPMSRGSSETAKPGLPAPSLGPYRQAAECDALHRRRDGAAKKAVEHAGVPRASRADVRK